MTEIKSNYVLGLRLHGIHDVIPVPKTAKVGEAIYSILNNGFELTLIGLVRLNITDYVEFK